MRHIQLGSAVLGFMLLAGLCEAQIPDVSPMDGYTAGQVQQGGPSGSYSLSELEMLKHKGDRNYLEFTLQKGAKPTLLSTVKLSLKKVDEKHSRYTMDVSADDRNIEKKDKNLDEPVQFFTGKDPVLYELVVNVVEKNRVSGYLSIPKNAPAAASAQ